MRNIDVWFPVSEVQGLIKSGGLADVAKALPKALQELGKDVASLCQATKNYQTRISMSSC